jgi:hypothetical protein
MTPSLTKIEIDGAAQGSSPTGSPDWLDLSRLNQRQNLEQFVECAVSGNTTSAFAHNNRCSLRKRNKKEKHRSG